MRTKISLALVCVLALAVLGSLVFRRPRRSDIHPAVKAALIDSGAMTQAEYGMVARNDHDAVIAMVDSTVRAMPPPGPERDLWGLRLSSFLLHLSLFDHAMTPDQRARMARSARDLIRLAQSQSQTPDMVAGLRWLGRVGTTADLPALAPLLTSSEPKIRRNAEEVAERLGTPFGERSPIPRNLR